MRLTFLTVFLLVWVAAVLVTGSLIGTYYHHLSVLIDSGSSSCGGG